MRSILPEFMAMMKSASDNFFFSFLALNFLNLRPFKTDIIFPVRFSQNKLSAEWLNTFDYDEIQDHGNSIRRHFLNDMVIAYERYSMLMMASHNNGQCRIDPSRVNDRTLGAHQFERLPKVYSADEVVFLTQLRHFRNSVVHYNGLYSVTNELSYTFATETYRSAGKEGQSFTVEFDTLLWIHDELLHTVQRGNVSYFANYPVPQL